MRVGTVTDMHVVAISSADWIGTVPSEYGDFAFSSIQDRATAARQIVQYNDLPFTFPQLPDRNTSDVACTAGHKNCHDSSNIPKFLLI
jgi:hypothetical protein